MTQAQNNLATASNDLTGVHTLIIVGWPHAAHRLEPSLTPRWVKLIAPRRQQGERWTFSQTGIGVLTCRSSLSDRPGLLRASDPCTNLPLEMILRVSRDRLRGPNRVIVHFLPAGGS